MPQSTSSQITYSDSLLFVNLDEKNLATRSQRPQIFSHIQQRYRPWQRQHKAKKLRKGAKVPRSTAKGKHLLDSDESTPSTSFTPTSPQSFVSKGSHSRTNSISSQASSPVSSHSELILKRRASPTLRHSKNPSIADTLRDHQHHSQRLKEFHGNSDPFNAFPIEVSPRVNDILKFYRDYAIPSQYHTGSDGYRTTKAARDDWQEAIGSLHDKGGALGFLARWAQVASNVTNNSELAIQALRYRFQSTAILRKNLYDAAGSLPPSALWHMITLYMAEVQAGNPQGAWLHATMIYKALKLQSELGQVDLTSLRSFLYNEAAACCLFLKRPVLDYIDWLPRVFEPVWSEACEEISTVDLPYITHLDSSIDDPFLRDMFLKQRQNLAIWQMASETAEKLSPAVFTWWCSSHLVNHSTLFEYTLDCITAAKQNEKSLASFFIKEAYLSLTVVYWMRLIAGDEKIFDVEIHQTKRPLLTLLRQLLEKDIDGANGEQVTQYANARLWAFYFGAQAEALHVVDGNWFGMEFTRQSAWMGLRTWEAVRDILDGFLDCDVVKPHGEDFVPALLGSMELDD